MAKINYAELRAAVDEAIAAGRAAAGASPDDGGSANLDRVVICARGAREASFHTAGIDGYRGRPGTFHLSAPFGGQGNRRYVGVQAMYRSLSEAGVDCYVHYQVD